MAASLPRLRKKDAGVKRELPLSPANGCRRCNQDFGSVSAFDFHFDCIDGQPVCLVDHELVEKGMHKDKRGRWRKDGADPNPFVTGQPRSPALWSASRDAA